MPTPFWTRLFHVLSAASPAENVAADACLRFVYLSCARLSRCASSRLLPFECATSSGVGNSNRPITMVSPESLDAEATFEAVFQARRERRVFWREYINPFFLQLKRRWLPLSTTGDDIKQSKLRSFASVVSCVITRSRFVNISGIYCTQ